VLLQVSRPVVAGASYSSDRNVNQHVCELLEAAISSEYNNHFFCTSRTFILCGESKTEAGTYLVVARVCSRELATKCPGCSSSSLASTSPVNVKKVEETAIKCFDLFAIDYGSISFACPACSYGSDGLTRQHLLLITFNNRSDGVLDAGEGSTPDSTDYTARLQCLKAACYASADHINAVRRQLLTKAPEAAAMILDVLQAAAALVQGLVRVHGSGSPLFSPLHGSYCLCAVHLMVQLANVGYLSM
jgi:hypothetical protein